MVWRIILGVMMLWHCTSSLRMFQNGRAHGGMLGLPNGDNHASVPPDKWFEQQLDHFNPADTRTWKQRYFTNDSFFEAGGPVFLMIGGEGEASPLWMVQGTWIEYAKRFKALCFQVEHRYYGKSHPTIDLSIKNLAYLNSEQALADLALFIESMTHRYELRPGTRWVAFGGSYPGSLAAWLRAKYPHLIHAAVSSSGPLIAKMDFKEYYGVVQDALTAQDSACAVAVKQATEEANALIQHRLGQQTLGKHFRLCDPINMSIPNDLSSLFESLASNFAGVVQYNKDNRKFEGAKGTNITIDVACKVMTNAALGLPVDRAAVLNSMLLETYGQQCLDYKYDKMVTDMRNVNWQSKVAEGGRQWMYQTCMEFGFYQTSSQKSHIFGDNFPVDFFTQQCADIFGSKFDSNFLKKATRRTNVMYGALALQASRVVFVHGSTDPWHALGITHTLLEDCPAIYINGTAHCANMYPSSSKDPPQLIQARQQVAMWLSRWLSR